MNKLNNNTYVGSGLNLSKRVGDYYKKSALNRNLRPIHAALLKYGHENFSLEILEYCKADELIVREQYYLDLLIPEYNVLTRAYSLLGFKHSPENIAKFKLKKISQEHKDILSLTHLGISSLTHLDKIVSQETNDKISLAWRRRLFSLYPDAFGGRGQAVAVGGKITISYTKKPILDEALAFMIAKTTKRETVSVSLLNTQTKEVISFTTMTQAGKYLGVKRQAIRNAIKRGSLVKGLYRVTEN